jgi:cytochrome c-type biogenesis protein CcmE
VSDPNEPIDQSAETLPWTGDPSYLSEDDSTASTEGTSAPPLPGAAKKRGPRLFVAAALLVAAGALTYLVIGGVEQNLVYYLTPSELLAKGEEGVGANVRLGGMVAKDTIDWQPESTTLSFTVKDAHAEVKVRATAIPPEMFREGIGVIVEGSLNSDGLFTTDRLMVRHSNEYKAPGDNESVDIDYMSKTLEEDAS